MGIVAPLTRQRNTRVSLGIAARVLRVCIGQKERELETCVSLVRHVRLHETVRDLLLCHGTSRDL